MFKISEKLSDPPRAIYFLNNKRKQIFIRAEHLMH